MVGLVGIAYIKKSESKKEYRYRKFQNQHKKIGTIDENFENQTKKFEKNRKFSQTVQKIQKNKKRRKFKKIIKIVNQEYMILNY